jgi:hypothetical protein
MSTLNERFAHLREIYPDDIEQIEADEKRVHELLKLQEYSKLDETKALIALCRSDIVFARKRLATDRILWDEETAMRELWAVIDARLWFLKMVAKDYDGELAAIESQLEADLQP